MPQAIQEGTAIAYGKGGLWTYRLFPDNTVLVEGSGHGELSYATDLSGVEGYSDRIRVAVKCLRRDGWPMDR